MTDKQEEQYVIGIDIGGTKAAYGLFDKNRKIVMRKTHTSNAACSPEEFFNDIAVNIKKIMSDNHLGKENLIGVGIGMPSFILFEEGRIIKTANLTNIHDFSARSYLMEKLDGIRVIIDNDANTAAIAEHRHGAGRGFDNMLYCPVGTGISCGIIIEGNIFRGSYGWAGETGHMIATPGEGIMCGCGNRGCFMSWTSGSMIIKHMEKWLEEGEKSSIAKLSDNEQLNCNHLADAYNDGDPLARRAIAQMVDYLGVWTYNLYVTFNINCYVFGGGLIKMFRKLKDSDGLLCSMKKVFDIYNKDSTPVYFKEAELSDKMSEDSMSEDKISGGILCGDDFGIIGANELLY